MTDLQARETLLREAAKRDHRKLGKDLQLFHIDEMVGQGLILWTPRGTIVRNELQNFISEHLNRQGYQQVYTPHIGKLDLFRKSGHFPYYQDSQYPPIIERDTLHRLSDEGCSCSELSNLMSEGEIDGYLLKPMNCPYHIRIYSSQQRSYRDLPLRLAEFGTVYRWEQSGEISGMTRVRGFTQDDAHLFVTEDQIEQEVLGCIELVKVIFGTLGMGYLGTKYKKKNLLCILYTLRAVSICVFIFSPPSLINSIIFGISFGLLWLSTVPPTNGIVAQIFGTKYLSTLFGIVFLCHQFGAFAGAFLGGYFYDVYGSYDYAWYMAIALSIFATAVHFPIDERRLVRVDKSI